MKNTNSTYSQKRLTNLFLNNFIFYKENHKLIKISDNTKIINFHLERGKGFIETKFIKYEVYYFSKLSKKGFSFRENFLEQNGWDVLEI